MVLPQWQEVLGQVRLSVDRVQRAKPRRNRHAPASGPRPQRPHRRRCTRDAELRVRAQLGRAGPLPGCDRVARGEIGLVFSAAFVGSLALDRDHRGLGRSDRASPAADGWLGTDGHGRARAAVSRDPLLLAVIALSGMVAVNANESTGLQTVDQALLPQSVPTSERTAAFASTTLWPRRPRRWARCRSGYCPSSAAGSASAVRISTRRRSSSYAVIGVIVTLLMHSRLDQPRRDRRATSSAGSP